MSTKPGDTYGLAVAGHSRGESHGSMSSTAQPSGLPSPGGFFSNAPQPRGGTPGGLIPSASSGSTDSPPLPALSRGLPYSASYPQPESAEPNARNITLPPLIAGNYPASTSTHPGRSNRLPATLTHQDTTTSMTSMGSIGSIGSLSNMSSGSGSSGMGMYPTTPVDEPWQGRPLTDLPRPVHPALAAHPASAPFVTLPPLKGSERSSESLTPLGKYHPLIKFASTGVMANQSPVNQSHPDADQMSRNLPPLAGLGGSDAQRRLRSASRGTTESGSPRDISDTIASTTDALKVLAYAGDMLEAEKSRPTRREQ